MSGSGSIGQNDFIQTDGDSNIMQMRTATPDQSIDPNSQNNFNNNQASQGENYDL